MLLTLVGICYVHAQSTGKHDIIVSSAAIQNLYRNCGNFVNINVPDLCSDYDPICTATDADIQQSTEARRKFLIVPKGNKSVLSVSNNLGGVPEHLGDIVFNVIEPPKPTIEILINGQRVSSSTNVAKGSQVFIKIVPDPLFALSMPQDAKYEIGKIAFFTDNCFAPIRLGEFTPIQATVNQEIKIPIPANAFQYSGGRKLYMEIDDIYRINFKGERKVDPRFTLYEKSISCIIP